MKKTNNLSAFILLFPAFFCLFLFNFYPILRNFYLSFTSWDMVTGDPRFIGLENYLSLLSDSTFRVSFWNNIHYTVVTVPLSIILGILIAMLMNVRMKGIQVFRVIYFLPQITSMIAIGIVWTTVLANYGPINQFLMTLGMENPPQWLSSSDWALISVEMVSIWRSMGYNAVILLAGLQGINAELYEAAKIDGAGAFRRFFSITLPMLSPTIFLCLVMQLIGSFKVFDTIMSMTQGGPGRATNVLTYYIYQKAFVDWKFGYASAVAYVLFAIIMILTLIQFVGQKKWVNY